MTTLTIEIPDKVEKTLTDLIEQLGGKVLDADNAEIKKERKGKLTKKEREFLDGIDESVKFINLHHEGKVEAQSIDDLLNEL